MASKPVGSQTCNPQSCVDCRLDDNHWFRGTSVWSNIHGGFCYCALKWGELFIEGPNRVNMGPCEDFCYSGVYHANDGYIYTRNTSVGDVDTSGIYGICRRPA